MKQLITELDSLNSRIAVIIFLAFWHGIYEITPHMGKTAATFNVWKIIISLIPICFQISAEPIKEVLCIGVRI
jgi:hypothetical protein